MARESGYFDAQVDAEAEDLLAQFSYHFDLQKSVVQDLSKALSQRPHTAKEDIEVLWEDMEAAKNPTELLRHRIDHILEGTFAGRGNSEDRVKELCAKYKLDNDATSKLLAVMARREMVQGCDVDRDLKDLDQHMAASRKPSALICMKLKHLSTGAPVGPCGYASQSTDPSPPRDKKEKSQHEKMDAPWIRGRPVFSAAQWSDDALEKRFGGESKNQQGVIVMKAGMSNADILKQLGKLSPERSQKRDDRESRDRRDDRR